MKTTRANKKRHHSTQKAETSLDKTLRSALYSLLIALGVAIALLLISTAIALQTPDPTALVDPIGYVSLFITAFFGGFATSKLNKHSPYLASILCGGAFVLLSMLFSLTLPHTLDSGMNIWTRLLIHALTLFTFPVGTFVGIKGAKPKKRKRR